MLEGVDDRCSARLQLVFEDDQAKEAKVRFSLFSIRETSALDFLIRLALPLHALRFDPAQAWHTFGCYCNYAETMSSV